jgi:hypothetical protein
MNVRYNLNSFDIDTNQKEFTDTEGNRLITTTLENILSLITGKYLYNEFESVEIHHTKFSNITNDYRKYLNYLRDKEILLINESYKKGVHSKSYMFTDHFKEYATVNRFKIFQLDATSMDDNSIIIDKQVSERIAADFWSVKIKPEPVEKEIRFVKDGQSVVKFRQYLLNEYALYRLRNTPRVLNWRSGRLYTPFVQLSNTVRRDYLYFDSHLTSLDIKRSFPLWLVVWLIDKRIPIDYQTKSFIQSVLSGNIYYDLMEKFNNNRNLFNNTELEKPLINKSQVKKLFTIWLNGNNNLSNLSNLIFMSYYPGIFNFVKLFKNNVKARMYNELVKLETGFIFNHVCQRLYNAIPGIQILTCHDEIYFEERFYAQVEKIWTEELEKVYDMIPVKNDQEFYFDKSVFESLGMFLE